MNAAASCSTGFELAGSRKMPIFAAAGMAISMLPGTSASSPAPVIAIHEEMSHMVTNSGEFPAHTKPTSTALSEAVRRLHSRSGLSWDQLAKIFGVSRRAVHKWANGGSLNSYHSALLARLTMFVDGIGGNAETVRTLLLAPNSRGSTLMQHLIQQASPAVPKPQGFHISELVGTQRAGDVTVLGDLLGSESIDWPRE